MARPPGGANLRIFCGSPEGFCDLLRAGKLSNTARVAKGPKGAVGHPVKRGEGHRTVLAIVAVAGRLGRMIPEEELRSIPKDLSDQIDHYVYGAPKR